MNERTGTGVRPAETPGVLLPRHNRDGVVVTVGGTSLDAEALLGAATAVAQRVLGAPVVAIDAAATIDTAVAVVWCLLAGVPFVPVAPDSGPAERQHVLADSRAALWLRNAPPGLGVDVLPVDPAERSSATFAEPAPDATAKIMYKSGTTGAPKGAVLSRAASPPASTVSPRPGPGPPTTSSSTDCLCSTCTG